MANIEFTDLINIAETEFPDIVRSTTIIDSKLRVLLIDNSYIDFWWSTKFPHRFAHHWERRHIDGKIFRHNNTPHTKWQHIQSFPQHFHFETDRIVRESNLSTIPSKALREFLGFARHILVSQ